MGLSQKVCRPTWVVLVHDPAIDHKASDWKAYVESGFDEKHLTFVKGEEPSRFLLKQLSEEQKVYVEELQGNSLAQATFGLRCILRHIKNYPVQGADGEVIRDHIPEVKDTSRGEMVTEKWMREFADGRGLHETTIAGLWATGRILSEASIPLPRPSSSQSDGAGGSKTEASTD